MRSTIGAAILVAVMVGCGSKGGTGKVCAPGASVSCVCSNAQMGAQVCKSDGAGYGACMCTGGPGAAGTTGGGGAAGTTGGAGAAGTTGGGGAAGTTGGAGAAGTTGGAGAAGTTGGAGAAGSTGGAGAAGTGGAPAICPTNTSTDLLSDFEVNASLAEIDGRKGTWSAFGDDQGTFSAKDIGPGNPGCSPIGAFHVKGSGFSSFASLFVDLAPRPMVGDGGFGDKMTVDASAYRGISFWAKTSTDVSRVVLRLSDMNTDGSAPPHDMSDPASPGSNLCTACRCIYNSGSALNCSPYGADVRNLDSTWRRFEVLFANTSQDPANPGYHPPSNKLDTTKLISLFIWIVPPETSAFEIWIDDVTFVR